MIAALLIVGGIKFSTNMTEAATPCHANGNNYSAGDPHPDYPSWHCQEDGTWAISTTGGSTNPNGGGPVPAFKACIRDSDCEGACSTTNASGATVTYNGTCAGNTCGCHYLGGNNSGGTVASSLTSTNPVVTWTSVVGATSYDLQVSESSTFGTLVSNKTVIGNSARVHDLMPNSTVPTQTLKANTKYYFHVRAKNAFGVSPWSNTFTFTTGAATTAGVVAPSVVAPSTGYTRDDFFSLLYASGASWVNASGNKVFPKQISKVTMWQDENGNRVFPSAESNNIVNLITHITDGGTVGNPPSVAFCNPSGFSSPTCTCTYSSTYNNYVVGGGAGCAISVSSNTQAQ